MGNAGSNIGHWFSHEAEALFGDPMDALGGFGKDLFNGMSGGKWDFSNVGRDIMNMGYDQEDAYEDKNLRDTAPESAAEAAAQAKMKAIEARQAQIRYVNDPNSALNSSLHKSFSSMSNNTYFGRPSNNPGATPPSNLAKISNPQVKMAMASTSGKMRMPVNAALSTMDNQVGKMMNGGGPTVNSSASTGSVLNKADQQNVPGIQTSSPPTFSSSAAVSASS